MSFEDHYYKSFTKNIKLTEFFITKKKTNMKLFFDELIRNFKLKFSDPHNRLFFIGNGASAAFSNHMTLDWQKNAKVSAYSLSDSCYITALGNDQGFDDIFLEYIKLNNISKNDFVIATSSSGNSQNIISPLSYCNENEIPTFSLTGLNKDNIALDISDFGIFVPAMTYGIVECIHQYFHHLLLDKFMGVAEWNKTEPQNMNIKNFSL